VTPARTYFEHDIATIVASVEASPRVATKSGSLMLVITVGLPGAGKSTFARRLAPLIDAVILQSDVLRRLLFTTPLHAGDESKRLFRAIQGATQRLLLDRRSVIVDATNLRETHRRPYREIAARTGARLQVVHLTAPEDVILDRLARRRDLLDPDEPSRAFEAVYALLQQQEEVPHGPHLRIDTSDHVAIDAALRTLLAEDNLIASQAHPVAPLAGSGVTSGLMSIGGK
jgi:predicted kinase